MSKETRRRKDDNPYTRGDMLKDKAKQVVHTLPIGVMIAVLVFILREVIDFKELASKQYTALIEASASQGQKIYNNTINIGEAKEDIALNRVDIKSLQYMLSDHKLDDAKNWPTKH